MTEDLQKTANEMADMLIEIGSEEIPASYQERAMERLKELLAGEFDHGKLTFEKITVLGTPRRLTVYVHGLSLSQPDERLEVQGPAVRIAFDGAGLPTKAGEGFARGQGVSPSELKRVTTKKGEYVYVVKESQGSNTSDLLPRILKGALSKLSFPKSMRWGAGTARYARPIHWIAALFQDAVIPFEFAGIKSGSQSRGHRFMAPDLIELKSDLDDYLVKLYKAKVMVDPAARMKEIRKRAEELAAEIKGKLVPDEQLIRENAWLTEWPVLVRKNFDQEFLSVPREVVITAMRSHQRYFAICDDQGKLLPHFIAVANTRTRDTNKMALGYARVLRARLADARFFYDEDLKTPFMDRVKGLEGIVFMRELGTMREKADRVQKLAVHLSVAIALEIRKTMDVLALTKAAILSKADLTTWMVGEFPELQGIVGREYALAQGFPPAVATAIADHYRPRGPGDALPSTDEGAVVALADKLDSLAGCFGINKQPTGAADPLGLRRKALGVIAITIDRGLNFPLAEALNMAINAFGERIPDPDDTRERLRKFFINRLKHLWTGDFAPDTIDAVLKAGIIDLVDVRARVEALDAFRLSPDFESAAETFKRTAKILKGKPVVPLDNALLVDDAEKALRMALLEVAQDINKLRGERKFAEALGKTASLWNPVHNFFDQVFVMVDDEKLRNNRFALLREVIALSEGIADFSRLSVEKEA